MSRARPGSIDSNSACRFQKGRHRLCQAHPIEGDLSLDSQRKRSLALVERPVECRGNERRRGLRGAGQLLRLRSAQCAPGTRRRIGRELGGALEERSRRSKPAASLRATGRTVELEGDILVRPARGTRAVPRPSIRVSFGVGRLGERTVHVVSVVARSRVVRGGANERVRKLDSLTDLEEPGVQGRAGRPHAQPQDLDRAVKQQRIAQRLGGGCENEATAASAGSTARRFA